MPSVNTVLGTLQTLIQPVVTGLVIDGNSITPLVGVGWPSTNVLQSNAQANSAVISIYDRKMTRNTTRWIPAFTTYTATPATTTATLSNSTLDSTGSVTLTIGGTITVGDSVGFVASNGTTSDAVVVTAGGSDTPATIASALVSAIDADPLLPSWVSATSSGAVVTITGLTPADLKLQANVGNAATALREIGRRQRQVQITLWVHTEDMRIGVGTPIETLLQQIETDDWIEFSDGTYGRLMNVSDFYTEDATVEDTYRRDFMVSIDYPITEQDMLYSVLAPVLAFQV